MNCREAIDVQADYFDATLTPDVLAQLEAHLRVCATCRAYLATDKSSGSKCRRRSGSVSPSSSTDESYLPNLNPSPMLEDASYESCRRRSRQT